MNLREISRLLYQIKLTNQEINTLFEKETGFSLTRYEMLMFLKDKGT
ncbi:MAG: transcriptional regulator, partial [Trichococcus flocculiformis]